MQCLLLAQADIQLSPDDVRYRGVEMADYKSFTIATNVQVYFCDPRSPWQRGSNGSTKGLLRQYFPRGTDLSRFSQAYLKRIALPLNQHPRAGLKRT